ncbi:hypothetical protein [Bartonella heixiaziensis]|uniref:hypothetical protein n=1 Tax=Bartonella heixiaziensis TaxID=1461000 RepID=UPI003D22A42C
MIIVVTKMAKNPTQKNINKMIGMRRIIAPGPMAFIPYLPHPAVLSFFPISESFFSIYDPEYCGIPKGWGGEQKYIPRSKPVKEREDYQHHPISPNPTSV